MSQSVVILEFDESNSVDYRWTWTFRLSVEGDNTFTLVGEQYVEDEGTEYTEPTLGLKSKRDILRALEEMLNEAGYELDKDWREEADDVVTNFGVEHNSGASDDPAK